jgi:hypothetical protein
MARPVWVTKAGDLGVIAERQFYNLRFDVTDADGGALTYRVVGGSLPSGLSLKDDGFIEGIPTVRKVFIRGVPTDVSEDVINTFAVRVQTTTGDVSDRTFTLTVSGQDIPVITSTTEALGNYFDGTFFEYQLLATDLDNDVLTWAVSNGVLPNGLTLDAATGLISGYINLTTDLAYGESGWINTDWDQTPWDFRAQSVNKNFQFTISVTDGKDFALQKYKIYIISKDGMTADNDIVTVDSSGIITADTDNKRIPVLLTTELDLGVILHDNYFAFKFDGIDFDGDPIIYTIFAGDESGYDVDGAGFDSLPFDQGTFTRPTGLELDQDTGWFYGYIPEQALLEQKYTIGIRVAKRDDSVNYRSRLTLFTFTIIGDLGKFVQWTTDTDLGIISNGSVSELYVNATNGLGRTLFYRLADNYLAGTPEITYYSFAGNASTDMFNVGFDISKLPVVVTIADIVVTNYTVVTSYIVFDTAPANNAVILVGVTKGFVSSETSNIYSSGELPQGLTLLTDGTISGRVSFNGFTIDGGTSTFDVLDRRTSSAVNPTTIDTVYVFTVEVFDTQGDISTFKTFSITVNLDNAIPYDNMYAAALLPQHDRIKWRDLINNSSLITQTDVYRPTDPFFGVAPDVRLLVAAGVYPETAAAVQAAVEKNHRNKRVQLGEIKTARALDSSGNVKYEVVYAEIFDNKTTATGISAARSLNLGNISIDGGFSSVIYPNSFVNMRRELYDNLTQSNKTSLPDWMSSKQSDGTILGLINAAIICYTKPTKSEAIAFNISRSAGKDLENFNIVLDRYIWDNNGSEYYDTVTDSFTASSETTFNRFLTDTNYTLVATVNYAVEVPFSEINARTVSYVSSRGLDSVTAGFKTGDTLIFATQENYSTPTTLAWANYTSKFDEDAFDSDNFDKVETIPGHFDGTNERTSVYTMSIDASNIITLTKTTSVVANNRVDIQRGGLKYGGASLFLDPSVKSGNTAPNYSRMADITDSAQTTFDNNGTKFFRFKDVYAEPDIGDAYIKWPQVGVFE